MRVILRWTCSQAYPGADVRLARFKRVLRAAQKTQWYGPMLEAAGLATPESLIGIDSIEQTLGRLPAVDLEEFCGRPAAFESPGGARAQFETFRSPLDHTPKTAILMAGFEQTSTVKVMARNFTKSLRQFAATALGGPVSVLRELAARIEQGCADRPALKHFVVPFTGPGEGELSEEDRERLWRVFQVPVFEQRLGFDGRLIAYECEAHDGLHILPERATFEHGANSQLLLTSLTDLRHPTLRVGTRLHRAIQHECCDCGSATARLVAARPLEALAAAC